MSGPSFLTYISTKFGTISFAFPTKKTPNYAMLGVAYIGAIYFVSQVFIHRKRRKAYEDSFKQTSSNLSKINKNK